jgi:DNA-binding NtrC family response regulator
VDLGSLHENLFESELFGFVKGAYTDAKDDKPGRFELANGGTLFLDEIGNLPYNQQSKILTALERRTVTRVGSNTEIPIDIRLVCATNMPIKRMVAEGKFREDLLYRINTFEIQVPPLRERQDDIPLLAEHFIRIFSSKYGKPKIFAKKGVLKMLAMHSWPGNIRELQNAIERAIVLCEGNELMIDDFFIQSREKVSVENEPTMNLEEMEKAMIIKALRVNKGNVTKAALDLGLQRNGLYRRMEKYGL